MGEYSFMKLIKLKKMGEFTLSFTSPEKDFFIHIYDVIVKPKKKRSVYPYSPLWTYAQNKARSLAHLNARMLPLALRAVSCSLARSHARSHSSSARWITSHMVKL